jgi:translocation and assembly module TamB
MDMAALQPMLGDHIFLKGLLSGQTRGNLLPGSRFDLSGQTRVSGGSLAWRGEEGELIAPLREASATWTWKEASLKGKIDLALERYGHAAVAFDVPLAAKLPPVADKGSPMAISMRGSMNEKGLLAALFPGMAQETSSRIDFDVTAGGTIANPAINGRLDLKGANAYLPSAGIRVKDVTAEVIFDNDRIALSSSAASGQGNVRINGSAGHDRGRITSYSGTIKGERFQALDLPELKASVSPEITFNGNMEKVTVRGSVLIPELLVEEQHKETLIKPSADVIVEGRREKEEKALPFAIDIVVSVILGDRVFVKAYGIDTRLAGKVNIAMNDPDDMRATGTISTVSGKFDAYGVKLGIQRGNVSFGGGPVDRANLDILALRTVGDVSAGVLVAGTPAAPLINLYSQPPMTDGDILSYIVLGRASGTAGKNDTALLARAASGLLTGGKSSSIQKQLGLDVLDVESADGDVSKSIVKVGKYLSPKLFISYGRSIYTGENIFGIRYSLTKRVDVESTMGNQSGAAIYYRIEFN